MSGEIILALDTLLKVKVVKGNVSQLNPFASGLRSLLSAKVIPSSDWENSYFTRSEVLMLKEAGISREEATLFDKLGISVLNAIYYKSMFGFTAKQMRVFLDHNLLQTYHGLEDSYKLIENIDLLGLKSNIISLKDRSYDVITELDNGILAVNGDFIKVFVKDGKIVVDYYKGKLNKGLEVILLSRKNVLKSRRCFTFTFPALDPGSKYDTDTLEMEISGKRLILKGSNAMRMFVKEMVFKKAELDYTTRKVRDAFIAVSGQEETLDEIPFIKLSFLSFEDDDSFTDLYIYAGNNGFLEIGGKKRIAVIVNRGSSQDFDYFDDGWLQIGFFDLIFEKENALAIREQFNKINDLTDELEEKMDLDRFMPNDPMLHALHHRIVNNLKRLYANQLKERIRMADTVIERWVKFDQAVHQMKLIIVNDYFKYLKNYYYSNFPINFKDITILKETKLIDAVNILHENFVKIFPLFKRIAEDRIDESGWVDTIPAGDLEKYISILDSANIYGYIFDGRKSTYDCWTFHQKMIARLIGHDAYFATTETNKWANRYKMYMAIVINEAETVLDNHRISELNDEDQAKKIEEIYELVKSMLVEDSRFQLPVSLIVDNIYKEFTDPYGTKVVPSIKKQIEEEFILEGGKYHFMFQKFQDVKTLKDLMEESYKANAGQ